MNDIDIAHYQQRAARARYALTEVFLDLFAVCYKKVCHGIAPSDRLMEKIRDALVGEL